MDLNKLLRRKEIAEEDNNQQLLAETCNKLGNHYTNESKHQHALKQFSEEAKIYEALKKKLDFARANRMIGEVYLLMGRYKDALEHNEIYLKISREEKDPVETQRAYASLGRCFLLQAEDDTVSGSSNLASDYKAAERAFLKSLIICKQLGKNVSKHELADMQARIYLNLGVTKEHMEEFDEALGYYETSIKISKANDLFELHYQCLMASGLLYSSKKNDTGTALNLFNSALTTAKRIQDKNEKVCETLLAKSGLLVKNGDFQSAKQMLKKAYKLESPNASDKQMVQKNLKIVLALCKCEDELVTTNSYDYAKRKDLFEKLGDGSCKLQNYQKAIDFYLKMLESAQLNGESEHQQISIYVSLYQTYIDNKDYEAALEYMKKEYELIKNEPKEACLTLLSIGNLLDRSNKDFWEVDSMYRKSLVEARKTDDSSLEKSVLQKLIKFSRARQMTSLAEILEQEATEKAIELNEASEEIDYSEDIGELDISLELQLSSDVESSDDDKNRPEKIASTTRNKRPSVTVKKNDKGETRLHQACINGNIKLAKMLIDQGHALNVRDNAGWLPLHEAANHGHHDIVELLLDNGATSAINDKGGTKCEGITPLYDAASNGNLIVVQLLLDRGAKATLKTDFNATPLDALGLWYSQFGGNLTPTEKGFYADVRKRLAELCEKVGIDTSATTLNTGSSGYNSALSRNSQTPQQPRQNLRLNGNFSDESEDEPEKENEVDEGKTARLEYKTVMNRLKNPNKDVQRCSFDNPAETKRRSGHLNVLEVGDDWLEDDLGPTTKKQKFYNEKSTIVSNSPKKNFTRKPSSVLLDPDSDVEVTRTENVSSDTVDAFDIVMNAGNKIKKKIKRRNSSSTPLRKPHTQPSLLDSGFARFVDVEEVKVASAKVPFNSSSLKEGLSRSIATEKQLIIKVQIESERVIVPVNKDAANELKISWLVEEAARRYYCIKGIRPELKLKTSDGATLLHSDPVALILSLTDENLVHSEILDWKLPSLSKRYIEACSELKCSVDQEINELLEINRLATHLDLSNQNLRPAIVRPILKALQHQNCLVQLDLSSNYIEDEGIKFLSQTLETLKQIQSLDISGNMMTETGLEYLCNALSKSHHPSEIRALKLSFNPIRSISLKCISNLCNSKSISSLALASCDLTDASGLDQLATIKTFDISYNHLTSEGLKGLLRRLNPSNVESLNFERCTAEADISDSIVQFISSGCYGTLREINLAGLDFNENEILDILRSVEKCEQLKSLDLSHQKQLSFLSLKYVLFSLDSRCLERVKLLGCKNIQDVTTNIFNPQNVGPRRNCLRNVQLSVPKGSTEIVKTSFIKKMTELWEIASGFKGKINCEKNVMCLFFDDDKEIPFRL